MDARKTFSQSNNAIFSILSIILLFILLAIYMGGHVGIYMRKNYATRIKLLPKLTYDLATIANDSELLLVTINAEKQLFLNKKSIDREHLSVHIQRLFAGRSSERKIIYVKASGKIKYDEFMDIVDIIKGTGATSILMQSEFLE